ncbi:TetR/AcrR family transcriptional regulator [Azohydromonas lata]|uniref:TetR/AcrR family transcriptional regulator n=1 Tax=Azohydromonas lata TaxID=45677 RepID=A0ABU5I7S3_9BURK|nr:TetR/AcrR family transcriptional regulator [Azohydromonas lata]MDZ5455147.1 TetR/AcrR family transcriptional regulator [Azohydromonas lata]
MKKHAVAAAGEPLPQEHTNADASPPQDHRVRVAEIKRERMRERLIEATMAAYLECEPGHHPVVDDVIRIAEVSRGSFYKHFEAIDEVFAEIGRRMAREMLQTYGRLTASLQDGAARMALGPLMALVRAAMEPRHGAFIARVDFIEFLASDEPRASLVAMSLHEGRLHGAVTFDSIQAAMDLVVGTTVEGARRIVRTRTLDGGYIRELAGMVLRGLGVSPLAADRAVSQAWQRLVDESATLSWWKPVSPA